MIESHVQLCYYSFVKQEEALKVLKLGHNVFLTGPPGSGKTFLLNQYIDYLKEKHKGVAITASTGIAATHLQGTTTHSWSGLGIKNNLTKSDLNKLLKKSYLRRNFEGTEVLIIDEISMLHASQFDLINQICQAFLKSARPFGGLQVVCSGDFFQLPPISRGRITKFVSQSWSWKTMDMKICHLEEQYRQQKEDDLFNLLNHIRNNEVEKACQILIEKRPRQDFEHKISIRLYTHNIDVDRINNDELKKVDGLERVYYMTSSGNKRLAESLRRNCLAPERLVVKKGAKVMFVKNNFKEGYVNGTLGKVIDFEDGWPLVKTAGGREIKATPMIWAIEKNNLVKAQIKQIPLRLAWAITVHKSQGMNLDAAEIDISQCFEEGMGYVALSRLRSLKGLKLMGINEMALLVNQKALEMDKVFREISDKVAQEIKNIPLPVIEDPEQKEIKNKISTYHQTEELILKKISLKEIAHLRNLKEDTILKHIEELVKENSSLDIEYLSLPKKNLNQIEKAFIKSGGRELSPVYKLLGGDFSYQELRLARIFIENRTK